MRLPPAIATQLTESLAAGPQLRLRGSVGSLPKARGANYEEPPSRALPPFQALKEPRKDPRLARLRSSGGAQEKFHRGGSWEPQQATMLLYTKFAQPKAPKKRSRGGELNPSVPLYSPLDRSWARETRSWPMTKPCRTRRTSSLTTWTFVDIYYRLYALVCSLLSSRWSFCLGC